MASMTKEELKTAIINHGLSPPPTSAKKEEFVEMYNEHVAPIVEDAGEFSSDDEVSISPKKRASQRSARTSAKSPKTSQTGGSRDSTLEVTDSPAADVAAGDDVDIEALDDEQLFQLLKENGVDVGPIVDSTRPLYKKKLTVILKGESGLLNGSTNGKEFSDTENEEEEEQVEEDDQPSVVTTPKERVSTRSKASSSSQKSTRSSARISNKSPVTTTTSLASESSGLRKRLNITEDAESSLLRSTPTPRRSIHSYKVTETTRQTIVLDKDGEKRDITRTVERVESKDAVDSAAAATTTAASLKKLLLLLLVVAVVCGLVYYFVKGPGTASVQSIMDSVRKIEQATGPSGAPEKPPPVVAEPPAAAPASEPAEGPAPGAA